MNDKPCRLDDYVEAYELAYDDQGKWCELLREEQNHHRFRRHRFAPVTTSKLRLRVCSTHGQQGQARVYQIRVIASKGSS